MSPRKCGFCKDLAGPALKVKWHGMVIGLRPRFGLDVWVLGLRVVGFLGLGLEFGFRFLDLGLLVGLRN